MGRWRPQFPEMLFDERFYRPMIRDNDIIVVLLVILIVVIGMSYLLFRINTRLGFIASALTSIAVAICADYALLYFHHLGFKDNQFIAPLALALTPPFILMVIEGLRGLPPKGQEDTPPPQGWTTWLTPGRVVWSLLIAASLAWGWDWSVWVVLMLTLGSLAAIPFVVNTSQMMVAGGNGMSGQDEPVDEMTEERARVMKLMEDGKITPGEASELLGALAETHRVEAPQPATATPHRRLMFIGAALLVVGLFLPWFSVNVGKEMNRAMGGMTQQMQQVMGNSGMQMPNMNVNIGGAVKINGGQVEHGLGWIVTVLGLCAALAPMLFAMRRHTERSLTLLCLIGGAVILLYVIASGARHVSYGLVLSLIGFVLIAVGGLREYELLTGMRFQPAKTAEGAH